MNAQYIKRELPAKTVVHHRDFSQILDLDTRGLKQMNKAGNSTISKTYAQDGILIREMVRDVAVVVVKSKVTSEIALATGSTKNWFDFALKAHELLNRGAGTAFERPLGYSTQGMGVYYSAEYNGKPLSSLMYELKANENFLLSFIRGVAQMHSEGLYHGHLFNDNILVLPPFENPKFVIVDPKLAYTCSEHPTRTPQNSDILTPGKIARKEKIQHDILPFLVSCAFMFRTTKVMTNSRFLSFLTQVERTYQGINRVSGDLLDEKFYSVLFPRRCQ